MTKGVCYRTDAFFIYARFALLAPSWRMHDIGQLLRPFVFPASLTTSPRLTDSSATHSNLLASSSSSQGRPLGVSQLSFALDMSLGNLCACPRRHGADCPMEEEHRPSHTWRHRHRHHQRSTASAPLDPSAPRALHSSSTQRPHRLQCPHIRLQVRNRAEPTFLSIAPEAERALRNA